MFHVEHSRRAWATGGLPYLGDPRRVAERRELRRLGFARKPGVEKANCSTWNNFRGPDSRVDRAAIFQRAHGRLGSDRSAGFAESGSGEKAKCSTWNIFGAGQRAWDRSCRHSEGSRKDGTSPSQRCWVNRERQKSEMFHVEHLSRLPPVLGTFGEEFARNVLATRVRSRENRRLCGAFCRKRGRRAAREGVRYLGTVLVVRSGFRCDRSRWAADRGWRTGRWRNGPEQQASPRSLRVACQLVGAGCTDSECLPSARMRCSLPGRGAGSDQVKCWPAEDWIDGSSARVVSGASQPLGARSRTADAMARDI